MANVQLSTAARNSILDGTAGLGTMFDSGILEIRNGTQPTEADDTATGTLLASITLPADSFAAAASGAIAKAGTWQDTSANADGTATWFRIKQSADAGTDNTTDERLDGDISTVAAGTGDLQLDNTSILTGQQVTISTFTITQPAS